MWPRAHTVSLLGLVVLNVTNWTIRYHRRIHPWRYYRRPDRGISVPWYPNCWLKHMWAGASVIHWHLALQLYCESSTTFLKVVWVWLYRACTLGWLLTEMAIPLMLQISTIPSSVVSSRVMTTELWNSKLFSQVTIPVVQLISTVCITLAHHHTSHTDYVAKFLATLWTKPHV